MQRSPVESRRVSRRTAVIPLLALALSYALTGCIRTSPELRDTSSANAPAPEAPKAPAVEPPPEGWTRLDLSTVMPELTGTIDLPPEVSAAGNHQEEGDADGLAADARHVQIGPARGVSLETMAVIPSRFASAEAMARFHRKLEHVSTHEFGPDHWAVVQRSRPGECMLHGWSAAAGLSCDVPPVPCDQMEQWVQVCGTLRPGPTPNKSSTTAKSAFPKLGPATAEVAMTVARAVARNDAPTLLSAIGPQGLKIGKKKYTTMSLAAVLARKTVVQVVAPITLEWGVDPQYNWNSHGAQADEATVWFTSAYGEQPYFKLNKTGDDWYLVEFGVYDLGEP